MKGSATGATVGGSMADVAQGNQAGHTAVDNNLLIRDWANFGTTDEEEIRKRNNEKFLKKICKNLNATQYQEKQYPSNMGF